jgi:putative endonuclease
MHRPAAPDRFRTRVRALSDPEVVHVHPKDVLGKRGEELAVEYLEQAGLRILDRNYRCAEGELDIVAADQRVLVACEVKTRSGLGYGTPVEAVTIRKMRRLRRLAVRWVACHGLVFDELRIDVIGVLVSPSGQFQIEHVSGAG